MSVNEEPLEGAASGHPSAMIAVVIKQNHSSIGVEDGWKENLREADLESRARA